MPWSWVVYESFTTVSSYLIRDSSHLCATVSSPRTPSSTFPTHQQETGRRREGLGTEERSQPSHYSGGHITYPPSCVRRTPLHLGLRPRLGDERGTPRFVPVWDHPCTRCPGSTPTLVSFPAPLGPLSLPSPYLYSNRSPRGPEDHSRLVRPKPRTLGNRFRDLMRLGGARGGGPTSRRRVCRYPSM